MKFRGFYLLHYRCVCVRARACQLRRIVDVRKIRTAPPPPAPRHYALARFSSFVGKLNLPRTLMVGWPCSGRAGEPLRIKRTGDYAKTAALDAERACRLPHGAAVHVDDVDSVLIN